ncbi:MAG: glycosyltransferase [Acidobacteria bacterium]|nr:glycosyltransferase [Acidobacteriota bacterium]MCB9377650.1 glycosyltransferase [Holophagales bacterium]
MRGGDSVKVLTPSGPRVADRWEEEGVEVASFRYAPRRFETLGYGRSLQADEKVRTSAGLVAPLYLLSARRALQRELASGAWDLVHAHWIVPNGLAAAPLARRIPLVVGLHGSDVFMAEKGPVRRWVRSLLRRTRRLTACSPELARRVEALGFDADRSHVIPYGVDVSLFRPDRERGAAARSRLGLPADAPVALGVGRMATKKGFHVLVAELEAIFAGAPELRLVLAGGGDLLEELRRRAAPWADRVLFPGPVLHDTLPDLYRAADFFVLPAVHDRKGNVDGLPNVILEAMASGLPVIASGISGIPLAVVPGESGLLVDEGDGPGVASAVVALANAPERRAAMGAAARRKAESELTWDAVAARYREAYVAALS